MMDTNMMMPLLTSLLLSKDSKWNVLIIIVLNFLVSNYSKIFKKNIFSFNKTEFTLKARIVYRNGILWNTSYPISFLAVSRKLKILLMNKCSKNYYEITEYPKCFTEKEEIIFFNIKKPLYITKNISIKTKVESLSSNKDGKHDYDNVTLEIILQCRYNDFSLIKAYIDESVMEYNIERLDTIKEQHIFLFNKIDRENKTPEYIEFPFKTTKSFNNMFFDQKQNLISRIDNFMNNKEEYMRLGIPYTMGILIHGEGGVGKTSCIKAIAEYTKRHVIIIPLSKIKSIDILRMIMMSAKINFVDIPNNKRLYVFEDADCSTWRDIFMNRELMPQYKKKKEPNLVEMVKVIDKISKKKKKHDDEDDDEDDEENKDIKTSVTLGDILELLDGLVEMDGRIIAKTTNFINVFDPALIRAGRFDIKLEFKRMNKQNVIDMFKLWFPEEEIPDHVLNNLKDGVFTQAEIGSLFSTRNFKYIYEKLITSCTPQVKLIKSFPI